MRILSFVAELYSYLFHWWGCNEFYNGRGNAMKVPVQVEGLKDRYDVSGVPPTVEK